MILRNAFIDECVDPRGKTFKAPKGRLIRGRVVTSSSSAEPVKTVKPFEKFWIRRLIKRELKEPLEVIIENDGKGYIARTLDLPLYGYGEDIVEAIDILKDDIETLYDDLMEDNNLTDEWLRVKTFLKKRIIEG